MARTKEVKGTHLTVKSNGELFWDWDALLKEVQEATKLFKPNKDIVKETETKLKKSRKK